MNNIDIVNFFLLDGKFCENLERICPKDDNDNTTYGISMFSDWDGDMVMFVKALATAYYGYDEFYVGLYDLETGTFHGAVEENGPYLECLKFYNKLFQKGLVDPDSLTQKYNGMSEDINAIVIIGVILLTAIAISINLYSYPLIARYENSLKKIIKNSFGICVQFFIKTLILIAVVAVEIIIIMWNRWTLLAGIIIGPEFIIYTISGVSKKIFLQIEKS